MATIENFATVSYTSGGMSATKTSNLAQIELNSSLSFSKTTLGSTYEEGAPVTYILSVTNSSSSPATNVIITDDLATFTEGALTLTPLSYVSPALLLIGGQDATASLTVDDTVAGALTFTISSIPAGATANVVYKALPNDFAPLAVGSTITNSAELTSDSECSDGTATATVTVAEAANVEVVKTMSPNPVVCGEAVTYTIRIYNYGNADATDVVLTDTFSPAPDTISVQRNGVLVETTGYTYTGGTLSVPSTNGDTVPAATFTRDATTGEISTTPGLVEYVITGII